MGFEDAKLKGRPEHPHSSYATGWIGHWKTTWSTVRSSTPHSRAAEEAIPNLIKQERKRPTPVRRRLTGSKLFLRSVGAGVEDESVEVL